MASSRVARPSRTLPVTLAIVALFGLFYVVLESTLVRSGPPGDYVCFYMGARMARDGQWSRLFDFSAQQEQWRHYRPAMPLVPYVRPPYYTLLQTGLTWWPLASSFWVATTASLLLLLGCWGWIERRWGENALLLGAMMPAAALGIGHGQDCVLMLAAALLSFEFHRRRRYGASGAALALCLFKYHLAILLFPALLLTRRWRMLAGLGLVAAVEALVSLLLIGLPGVKAYAHLLLRRDVETLYPSIEWMPNLHGLLANFGVTAVAPAGLFGVLALALWARACWQAPWWCCYTASVAGAILISPHVFGYDLAFLLPGLLLTYLRAASPVSRGVAVALCTPLPIFLNVAGPPYAALNALLLLTLLASLAREAMARESSQPAVLPAVT